MLLIAAPRLRLPQVAVLFSPGENGGRGAREKASCTTCTYTGPVKVVLLNELVAGSYTSLANVSRTIPLLPMPRSSHRASSIKVSCLVALQLQRPRLGSRTTPAHVSSLSNLTLFVGADTDIHFILGFSDAIGGQFDVSTRIMSLCLLYRARLLRIGRIFFLIINHCVIC